MVRFEGAGPLALLSSSHTTTTTFVGQNAARIFSLSFEEYFWSVLGDDDA